APRLDFVGVARDRGRMAWPPTEEEQLVAKRRDLTFAMLLRAWLLRHRATHLLRDARRAVKESRAAAGEKSRHAWPPPRGFESTGLRSGGPPAPPPAADPAVHPSRVSPRLRWLLEKPMRVRVRRGSGRNGRISFRT